RLVRVVGFQIVNGGQTTASLFDASRLFNLSPTAVPMKLVIVKQQEHIDDLVKEISKYTNSQNKVSVSDLVANERFHRDLERESRAAVTPAPTGMIGTQWFYERARAQYADERARQTTPTQRARWERDHPYKQKLTKTLVAKYEMAWGQYPHTVCLGAEKNYNAFQAMCDVTPIRVTPLYFRELVARAIVFQACDKVAVPLAPGWKANTVAYAVAAFSYAYGALFDHISVWEHQAVTPATLEALKDLVVMARDHLSAPPVSGQNIGEWSKRPACWEQFKEKVQQRYIARPLVSDVADVEVDTPNLDARIHRPELVASAVWLQLHAWGSENDRLTSQQRQACLNLAAASAAGRRANPSFYRLGSEVVRRAVEAGFELPPLA
ncbi:MAG: AIPR family protein, partial [Myxococcales bacterium]|nr:AIPR family protein [Myxococcales bacterium]